MIGGIVVILALVVGVIGVVRWFTALL